MQRAAADQLPTGFSCVRTQSNCRHDRATRVGSHRRETIEADASLLSLSSPPDRRIRSRPNRRSPEEFGVAPEQSILRLP
jgi:hypothetical protein